MIDLPLDPGSPTSMALHLVLGLFAGTLTTIAGMGGGMALTLALSLFFDARAALASTSPALLFGNVHRVWLFRKEVRWDVTWRFALGALPGALLGAMAAASLPDWALSWLILGAAAVVVLRALGWLRFELPKRAIVPSAAVTGAVAATTGGAAPLIAPILLCSGVEGSAFVATASAASVVMHLGRVGGYAAFGMVSESTLIRSGLLLVGILVGNAIGRRMRGWIGEARAARLTYGVLLLMVAFAVLGVAH